MSYSFSTQAPTKAEVKAKVRAEMAKVVEQQPIHTNDRQQAIAATEAFIDLLAEPAATHDVVVSVNGSIWNTDAGMQQVSVSISVGSASRK